MMYLWCFLGLLAGLLDLVLAADNLNSTVNKVRFMALAAGALFSSSMFPASRSKKRKRRVSAPHRKRTRRTIDSIFNEMGPYYVRRAYRMHQHQFWKLHQILKEDIATPKSTKKKHRNGGKNGIISTDVRLSAAIRYFAGGRPSDIAVVHGIAHSEVFNSV